MKIFGIGTDIVNIKRMKKSLKLNNGKLKKKVFSKNEIKYCENKKNPSSYFAKRFAAKEAFSKALGTGIRKGLNLKNIEISNNNYGKPTILLRGDLRYLVAKIIKNKKYNIYLSLSDDKPWAQATVIISYY